MSSMDPVRLPKEGERLVERYTIVSRVNFGGFGAVYRAIQDTLGREVAIKVLLPEVSVSNKDYVDQFRQEALLTSQLRHPNTITIYDYGQTEEGLLFLVMEWLDGQTLSELLRSEGALSYERCYNISFQILKSLAEAHDRGMVHRDLKPSNLFLCTQYGEADFVKVLDFGLVKNLGAEPLMMRGRQVEPPRFTEKRRAPGTPHYMAPEQATGKGTTTSADIYSFGLLVYEMLTGQRAFDGQDKMEVLLRQAREPAPPLPLPLQSTFLGKVVARCVEKDPLKRPQKAGELIREYQRVEDTGGVEVNTAEIRTTANWRTLARPKTTSAEITSGPGEQFVGRSAELEEFSNLLEKGMQSGQGIVMTVSGPTGIGKTTLVRRFADQFMERTGSTVLRGGFLPHDRRPLSAFRRALRSLLNVQSESHGDGRFEIRQALDQLGISDIYLLNFLVNFLLGAYGFSDDQRDECAARIGDLLERLGQRGAVLFVIENLNWADAESLELLWRLAVSPVVRQRPVFLVATFRTTDRMENRELSLVLERLDRLDHMAYRELRVGWLGKRECMQIISSAINMHRTMASRCLTLSKGNPLFLNLVLRYLIDEGEYLSRQVGDAASVSSKLYLPSSLDKIALRRVEQVVRKYGQDLFRELLRRAALMGESFVPAQLEEVLRKEGQYELVDRFARTLELWRREGLLRRPWDSEPTMEFVHPHLVEFFFADSEPSLHLLVAKAKEELAVQSQSEADAADLARHYRVAQHPEMAIQYFSRAAELHQRRYNFAQARILYEELLPLLDLQNPAQRQQAKSIHYELGALTMRLSEFGPSADYFDHALAIAQAEGDHQTEGICYCGKADLALLQNQIEEADSYFHRARSLVAEHDGTQQGRLLLGLGRVSSLKGDWAAAQSCFQRAYDEGGKSNNFELMARTLHELGKTAFELGNIRAAHEWFSQAQNLHQQNNRSADEADVLLDLVMTTYFYRRVDDARSCAERAIETQQRLGDPLGVARGMAALGQLEAWLLHVDEASKFVLRALPVFKERGYESGQAHCKAVLGHIDMVQGQFEKAESLTRQALEHFQHSGLLSSQVRMMQRLGRIAMLTHRSGQAQEQLNEALMLLDVHGSNAYRSLILRDLGLCQEYAGDFAQAEAHYLSARDIATQVEWYEEQQLARLALTKLRIFYQGGRSYYDELWEIASEARAYGLRALHLNTLLVLSWFEGVYGDQPGWEAAIAELNHHSKLHRVPISGLLTHFEFEADVVRQFSPEVASIFRRSANWIRQSLLPSGEG
ncbi:MAG: protein kinase [Myxococcota bacterium]|nr:protein kinase [Myxococcota bacterium]